MTKQYIYNTCIKEEAEVWNTIVEEKFNNEPMAKPYYVQLFCEKNDEAIAIFYEMDNGKILYPFIKRKIKFSKEKMYDTISAYGYGGPLSVGELNDKDWIEFWKYVYKWYQQENIITEIIKFNLFGNQNCNYQGNIEKIMNNIVRQLNMPFENIVASFEYKVRKNVKRAINSELSIAIDNNGDRIDDFMKIYYETMERRDADKNFYFEKDFFNTIHEKMKTNFCYFYVYKNQMPISVELVLLSRDKIYSYLGGTIKEYYDMRPNDYLKYEIIKWGVDNGYNYFILGGGHGEEDGIFRYKKAFAPEGQNAFYIGTNILNQDKYNELCDFKNISSDNSFVPAYRL